MVGFDDEAPAKRALDRAIEEAKQRGARLAVLAVGELPLDPGGPRNFGTLDDGPIQTSFGTPPQLADVLADAERRLEGQHVKADYLWALGDPARSIVDLARERSASLIVLGEHHRGLLAGLFGLDVPEQVRRHADCDILVVE